jgi:hypothetical protein
MPRACGDTIQKSLQSCTDGERIAVHGHRDSTSTKAPSNETEGLSTEDSATVEDGIRVVLTRSELAGLSPVARQILSELLLGIEKASDSVSI